VTALLREISLRVKLAVLTGVIIAVVVLGQSFETLIGEAIAIQEEIALETRLVLVSLAGAVGSLWTDERIPDLEALAARFEGKLELRSFALLANDGEVVAHHGLRPSAEEVRMVTRLRLRTVPRTLWGIGAGPLELVIATPILRGDEVRGHLLCAIRTNEPAQRIRELMTRSLLEALLWIALGAGLMLWITRRITRPLAQLSDDLLHLERGFYRMPEEGRAEAEIGVVQDRLVELSEKLETERDEVTRLTGQLNHQIHVISAGLEARAAELAAVLDSVRDAVLVVTLGGSVLRINEPGRRFFGDAQQQRIWERVEDPSVLQRAIERACGTQSPTLVHTHVRADASTQPLDLRVRIAPLLNGNRATDALVVVAEDLSASRELTEHMMRSERLASMATLTAGMAHQLGNHLNAIKGYADLLRRRLRDGEETVLTDLASIAREVRAAAGLLERTHQLSRTRSAAWLDFPLAEVLRSVRESAALAASSRSVSIELELPEQDLPLRGDPELLEEALLNLAINGIQAMRSGGTLRLHAIRHDAHAVVAVSDEGGGIPEAVRSRIFDPFFTTKQPGEGTGLGLAIAHRIVELHGGEISLSSSPGVGTRFEVRLPLQLEGTAVAQKPEAIVSASLEGTS
jgi:signal transduction histidine kinase